MRDEPEDADDVSQNPDDAVADSDTKPTRRRPPSAGKVSNRAPVHVLQLRIARVATLMVRGLGRSLILQVIARDQREEAQTRSAALASGSDRAEAETLAPVVWGDVPVPERTVDTYIQRAKIILGAEAKTTVVKHREYAAAVVLARYGDLYALAIEQKKLSVARNVLVDLSRILGVRDIVTMMQMADATAQSQAEREKSSDNLSTEQGRANSLASLLEIVKQRDASVFARVANKMGGGETSPASTESNGHTNGKQK